METNESTNDKQVASEKIKDFLQQLTELTRKTGVGIAGCGCCRSPFTFDLNDDEKHFVYGCNKDGGIIEWGDTNPKIVVQTTAQQDIIAFISSLDGSNSVKENRYSVALYILHKFFNLISTKYQCCYDIEEISSAISTSGSQNVPTDEQLRPIITKVVTELISKINEYGLTSKRLRLEETRLTKLILRELP